MRAPRSRVTQAWLSQARPSNVFLEAQAASLQMIHSVFSNLPAKYKDFLCILINSTLLLRCYVVALINAFHLQTAYCSKAADFYVLTTHILLIPICLKTPWIVWHFFLFVSGCLFPGQGWKLSHSPDSPESLTDRPSGNSYLEFSR